MVLWSVKLVGGQWCVCVQRCSARRVRVDAPDGVLRGTAVDIAPGLVLRGADGTMRTVDAGDVSHVRTDGAVD